MADNNNKVRVLYLLKYLFQNTDEEHQVTTQELIDILAAQGFKANRKTVKDDIDMLTVAGYDIITEKSASNSFFYGFRDFELPEIKLLIDAVSSSKHISLEKSKQLIDKLTALESKHRTENLVAHLHTDEEIKVENSKFYYIVDTICRAMNTGKQIAFQYYDYTADRKKILKNNGEWYTNSPYSLIWNEDRYYLIGYSEKWKKVISFRVDWMYQTKVLDTDIMEKPEDFHTSDYAKKVFRMYGGEEQHVVLKCDNTVMRDIVDRFGEEVETKKRDAEHFMVYVDVSVSRTFFSWLFQFAGKISVLKPENVRNQYLKMAKKVLDSQ
ncbi:MAG: WYL domain-containing protein [Lachnospiraceae bacterium]|nr:WYL domain-containing protein [Lachnospiraceae bacterium]